MLAGGGAVVLLAAVAGGSFMLGGGGPDEGEPLEIPDLSSTEAIPVEGLGQLAAAEKALAEEAKTGGAPATAVNDLVAAGEQLDSNWLPCSRWPTTRPRPLPPPPGSRK